MAWYHPKTLLDKIFEGGIILKGVHGALEFIGGLLLLVVSPTALAGFATFLVHHGMLGSARGRLATALLHMTQTLNGSRAFLIAYLWVHAGVKLVAVFGILRNKLWAYPFSLVTLGVFMGYQLYRIFAHASVGLVLLTLLDAFILWLIWREYGIVRSRAGAAQPEEPVLQ